MAETIALLLPGMSLNSTIMPDLGCPAVAVDFNDTGFGRSMFESGTVAMERYVIRLDRILRETDEWRQRPRLVVGHSFGGMLALSWLLTPPDAGRAQVDGLVLIATTAGPMYDVARLRLGAFRGHEARIPLEPVLPIWNLPLVTRAAKLVLAGGRNAEGRVDFRSLRSWSDASLDLAGWRNTDWRAMRAYRLAMRGFDVRAGLGNLRVPTIVLHGTEDALFPVSVAEDLARRLPDAELRVVPGAGHGLSLTHGREVVRAVEDLRQRVADLPVTPSETRAGPG